MSTNKLKVDSDKIVFPLIGNEQHQSKYLSMFSIELFRVETNPTKSTRSPAIILDQNFTFCSHISAVCSSYYYHIQELWCIRHYLYLFSAEVLVDALVTRCLNYCNSCCLVLQTLTCLESTGPCCDKVTTIYAGFEPRLVPLSKALYHTCFICGQRCKCWSRRPKLTSSVIQTLNLSFTFYIYSQSSTACVPLIGCQ